MFAPVAKSAGRTPPASFDAYCPDGPARSCRNVRGHQSRWRLPLQVLPRPVCSSASHAAGPHLCFSVERHSNCGMGGRGPSASLLARLGFARSAKILTGSATLCARPTLLLLPLCALCSPEVILPQRDNKQPVFHFGISRSSAATLLRSHE
ncbi:unnamed protein product [Amoebophrya sp. A120]|nr:unnamed protein product [Amoebophrya sp. A120]|eukprot:GSA120T00018705001.1